MRPMHRRCLLAPGLALLLTGTAGAADLPVPAEPVVVAPALEPRWSFAVAAYLWAAGIEGDIAQFGLPTVDIDASFSDIFDYLDFAAMASAEIRYDRFGLFTDLMYVKLSGASASLGILSDRIEVDTETLVFTAAPEYRLLDRPRGSLDAMVGGRVWSVDTEISFQGGDLDGTDVSDGETWIDPLIGVKGRYDITDKFFLTSWGMIGGFGVSSDFMWDAWGGVGYEINDTFSAVLGYRGTGVDFEDDGFVYDVIQHGPVLGGIIRF